MLRLAAIAGCVLTLAAPAFAYPPAWQHRAIQIARAQWAWHRTPDCATPTYHEGPLPNRWQGYEWTTVRAGHATCVITIIPGLDWQRYCTVVTHEVGHSVLGGHWFARVNPSNPAHSPSPRSVMYPTATTPQACTHRPPTT